MKKLTTALSTMFVLLLVGCATTSSSYKETVKKGFPLIAERLDGYQKTAEAQMLRNAAQDPITLESTEPIWARVAPVYRGAVKADTTLWDLRREQWLKTADIIDSNIQKEYAYRQKATGR